MKQLMFLAALAVVFAGCKPSTELVLAERGKPAAYTIVLPDDPSASQRYAAEELQTYVEMMTGVRLPIAGKSVRSPAKAIFLGLGDESLGEDGFRLRAKPPHLEVFGSNVRGTLYGVYSLLEDYGGCRWYVSWHTNVPYVARFTVPITLNKSEKPAFACRDNHWWDHFKPDFAAHNKLNGPSHRPAAKHGGNGWRFGGGLGNCHTFVNVLSTKQYGLTHPEYFALRDGKRCNDPKDEVFRSQLCLSNPDVLRIVTSNVLSRIRRDPNAKYYGISQNDNQKYCQCPACEAIDKEEGSHSGTVIRFVNEIAAAVEKEFPGKTIETLAYNYSRHLPKKTKPRHNVLPCLCSIECDFGRPLDASPDKENISFMQDLRDWSAACPHLYVWDYVTDFSCYPHPFPNIDVLQRNVQIFRDAHVETLFEQGACQGRHAGFAELKSWLLAKWMWNPDLPADKLVADFMNGYYGKAAPVVTEILNALRQRTSEWLANPTNSLSIYQDVSSNRCRELYPDDFIDHLRGRFADAADLVADEPMYSYNVRMSALSLDYIALERIGRVDRQIIDFVTRKPASRVNREKAVRLVKSVMARMKEAGDIRLSSGDIRHKHTKTLENWKRLLQRDREAPPPFGIVPDAAFNIVREGEWTSRVQDPEARDGMAVRISNVHYGWCVVCDARVAKYKPDQRYEVYARVRVEPKDGANPNKEAFSAGIYDPKANKSRGHLSVKVRDVQPGYEWYHVGTWTPAETDYIWLACGWFDRNKNEKAAVESVWVDELRLVEEQ